MEQYRLLHWDSTFFGFPVARIIPDRLPAEELQKTLGCMKQENIVLAYWSSDPSDRTTQKAAELCHGFLADRKVTFVGESGPDTELTGGLEHIVEEYTAEVACATLEDLAVQASIYSRFRVDPRIPDQKCVDLYKRWIQNSANRQMADAVLIARRSDRIVGLATVRQENGLGKVGLFAVDAGMRRKRVGTSLIDAVQAWSRRGGLNRVKVVTQEENAPACTLYRNCGYRPEKTEYVYHFWLS